MPRPAYRLLDAGGKEIASGNGEPALSDDGFTLLPEGDAALRWPLTAVVGVSAADFRLSLALEDGGTLTIERLGPVLGDLLGALVEKRNEVWERGLLYRGVGLVDAFPCEWQRSDGPVRAELRVYQDRVSLLPSTGDPTGLPLALVSAIDFDEATWQIAVRPASGPPLVLGKLRQRATEARDLLQRQLADLRARTAEQLGQLLAGVDGLRLQALARLMPDGVAARRADVEAAAPGAWARIEAAVAGQGDRAAAYRWLAERSPADEVRAGVRLQRPAEDEESGDGPDEAPAVQAATAGDGAAGDEEPATEEAQQGASPWLTWFLCPLRPELCGGATVLASEVTSEGGHATYLFRLHPDDGTPAQVAARVNLAMLALGFRRQPIYQTSGDPAADRWAFALRHRPELRWLRERFIGRAIHRDPESWQRRVEALSGGGGR